ncbi:4-hydroxy-2-oxovalerate aldolase [Moorella thermoacetica]|uniref:4-hydroxy-2-oxovalerate aldolase n=1 Tax=Neomoorella thermoacetica TaxID=1525 RepID=A0AAC9MTP6_NEOTH|nr:4-hydroxy-2-oxovalerate aldolase [Moorella thermoacetica]AOQ22905.1 4-hydroxy-2-oxovalerate aldolase [Moorella thermoacetica]TYL06539.1 4-hydroxy-2-oxovalerate aldolase [Moorella thermoacetica]
MSTNKFIHVVDTTLRDGSHAVSHQFTPEQVTAIAGGLDAAGVEYIEISHGDGLAGSSYNYGWSAVSEKELLKAASKVIKNGKLTVLLLPGIGTVEDLKMAADCGAKVVRVATHVTEADIGEQHIGMAKKLGMMAVGFLMMCHMAPPEKVVEQAKLFESYGADYINIADSAGAMLPEDVKARVGAVVEAVKVPVGFHAHNNLTMATANALAAVEAGATFLDGACRGLGAGAGNAQTEALVGVLDKLGYRTGVDFYKVMDVAEEIVEPIMHRPQVVRNAPLMLGYAGVYSSFLLHTYRAAEKFNLDPRDILVELGRRRMVGGQEDMIVDVAYQLAQKRGGN